MHPRRLGLASLLLAGLMTLTALAQAAGRVPVSRPVPGQPRAIALGAAKAAAAECPLGVTGPAVLSIGYIAPPDDAYYTLIDPSECEDCDGAGVLVTSAHVVLDAWDIGPWPVRVGIVRADLSDPECPAPIPGDYLSPPIQLEISAPEFAVYDFTLALGQPVTLNQPAFLEITFYEWGQWWTVPGLVTTGSCESCRSYNYYPGDDYDLCAFGFDGNPIMYVDAACASAVPTGRGSWGRLKSIYR